MSWAWRTAATGDGIVADEVNTGKLRTVIIEGGVAPENNFWNLDTSDFRVGDADSYLQWSPSAKSLQVKNTTSGDYSRVIAGEVRSYRADSSASAILGSGRVQFYDNAASLFIAGRTLMGTDWTGDGTIQVSHNKRFAIGRYNDYSTGANPIFHPYMALEYVTANDETNGYVRFYKQVRMNKDLYVAGGDIKTDFDVYARGIMLTSDEIYKENILPDDDNDLDTLKLIDYSKFNWKADGKPEKGFVANQVQEVAPHLIRENAMGALGYDSAAYTHLIGHAVQQLAIEKDAEISALKQELADLKKLLTDKGVI